MSNEIVNISLPEDIHTMLKNEATKQDKTLTEMVEEMIIFYLRKKEEEERIKRAIFAMD